MRLKEELLMNYQAQAAARQGSQISYVPSTYSSYSYGNYGYSSGLINQSPIYGSSSNQGPPININPNPNPPVNASKPPPPITN